MGLKLKLGKDFAAKLRIIEQETEKIWKKGEMYHVYYTLHGLDHSNNIITILDKLVDGLNPADALNDTEIFCLLSSVYLHDVGMQCKFPNDVERAAKISELKKRPYTFQDLIRDEHHIRSGQYIKDTYKNLKLDHVEAECIRLISEGHRQIKLESKEYDDQPIGFERVRVRLLAALLRLADELDIVYTRAPETLLDILKNDMPDYSRIQWLKHYYTSGILINTHQDANGKKRTGIEVHCQYPNEDVGRKITEVLISKHIEETLNDVRIILLEHGLILNLDHKIKCSPDLKEIPADVYDKYLGQKLKVSMELPRTKGFVGRNNELADLLSSLDKNVIIIEGIAGIGKTNYPIIRLKEVKIISEEIGKHAEIFYPFTGSITITKDDENLKEIMQKLIQSEEIDFDMPEIMGIQRNKALLILGFLFKKGFLDCRILDKQKFDLRLTDRGLKILRLSTPCS